MWSDRLRRRRILAHVLILWTAIATIHGVKISRLHLGPQRTRDFSVADFTEGVRPSGPIVCTVIVAGLLVRSNYVVLSVLNGFRAQRGVEVVAPRVLVGPLPHGVEHVLLNLDVLVADGWVVKGAEHVVDDFVYWHA